MIAWIQVQRPQLQRPKPQRPVQVPVRTQEAGRRSLTPNLQARRIAAQPASVVPQYYADDEPDRANAAAASSGARTSGALAALVLSQIGAVDRELRPPDALVRNERAMSAFQQLPMQIESAYIDRSTYARRGQLEMDGLIYYSLTRRGKTTCTMAGLAGPPAAIRCPAGAATWSEY